MNTYMYMSQTVLIPRTCHTGPECVLAGVTKLPFGHKPIMFYNGEVSCLTLTGKLQVIRLQTHSYQDDQDLSEPEVGIIMIHLAPPPSSPSPKDCRWVHVHVVNTPANEAVHSDVCLLFSTCRYCRSDTHCTCPITLASP